MTKKTTVAVGVPVYNGEAFLASCLESLLCQTRPPDEIIVSDNCSTDETLRIARDFEKNETSIRVISNTTNLGAAPNFNRLVDVTDADLFAWAPADDTWTPDLLAAQEDMLADPSVACAYGDLRYIDTHGQPCGQPEPVVWSDAPDVATRSRELLARDQFRSHLHVCGPALGLMRRRQLRETGLIRPFGGSDKALIIEMALRGRLTPVDPVIHRRKHPDSSVVANPDAESRHRWFDPSLQGPATPTWSLFTSMLRSASAAPLSRGDRATVTIEILRWTGRNRILRVMGGEVKNRLRWRLVSPVAGRQGQG